MNVIRVSTTKPASGRLRRLWRAVGSGAAAIVVWEMATLGIFVLVAEDAVDTLAQRLPAGAEQPETGRWAPAVGVELHGFQHVPAPTALDGSLADDPARLDAYANAASYGDGVAGAFTTRWPGPSVAYRMDLPGDYPPGVAAEVDTAFRWVSAVTGVRFIRTTGLAEITIVGRGDNGGLVRYDAPGGQLTRADVEIGCCRRGVIWEEVLHVAGLADDAGPPDSSVAAYPRSLPLRDTPSAGDATALAVLYRSGLAPGTPAEAYRQALQDAARSGDLGPP